MLKRGCSRSACEWHYLHDVGYPRLTRRFILNDTYRTDVHLLYPPYIIALSSLYIGFCLTAMSSNPRTRITTSQITSSLSNASLELPPPPSDAAEFIASFQVSLPVLFACVQDLLVLYPIWEGFEPSARNAGVGDGKEAFGMEEAEGLVRKMIEDRLVDVGHPDDAGGADGASGVTPLAGKKRTR